MATVANKRSVMTLYSDPMSTLSHWVRIVLAEKGVTADIIPVVPENRPQDLLDLNPYGTIPTLVDRDLVLYNANIIIEYLDERFPHPPLMPVYPVARAKCRLMIHRLDQDWTPLVNIIETGSSVDVKAARKQLSDSLISIAPIFAEMPYFLSEEFSLVDCALAPILWRLPKLGIEIPPQAKAISNYAQRIFDRPSFKMSLTEAERDLKVPA